MNISSIIRRAGRTLWSFRQSRAGFILLWVLVIVFVGKAALDSYAEYDTLTLSVRWTALAVAMLILMGKNLLIPVKWVYMLNVAGDRVSYLETARAYYLSQLSSLIPGGVWQYLDLGYRVSEQGKSLENVAHAAVYVQGMTVATALFYAAVAAAVYRPGYAHLSLLAASVIFVLSIGSVEVLERIKGVLHRFGIQLGDYRPSKRSLLTLFIISLAIWPVSGAVLFFVVASLTSVPLSLFIPITGVMAASWAAGFLILILPGGLGVREGAMILLLSNMVAMPVAIAASVLARIVALAGRIGTAAFFGVAGDGGGGE